MVLDKVPFDLLHLLESLVDIFGVLGTKKGLDLCLDVHDPGPVRLRFEVEDTGRGIPPEKRDLVFSDYCQADGAATTQSHGGTGLGLGIVQKVVRMMDGEIAFVDKNTPGCLICFDLVFAAEESARDVSIRASGQSFFGRSSRPSHSPRPSSVFPVEFPAPLTGATVVLAHANFMARSIVAGTIRELNATVVEVLNLEETSLAIRTLASLGRRRSSYASPRQSDGPASAPITPSVQTADELPPDGPAGSALRDAEGRPLRLALPHLPDAFRTCLDPAGIRRSSSGGLIDRGAAAAASPLSCALLDASILPDAADAPLVLQDALQKLRADIQEGTVTSPSSGGHRVAVVWIVGASTPPSTRAALQRAGFVHLVQKPLYRSKVEQLLRSLTDSPEVELASLEDPTDPHVTIEIIPASPIFSRQAEAKQTYVSMSGADSQRWVRLRFLVVEDNPVLSRLTVRAIEKLGAQVATSGNGQEALGMLHVASSGGKPPFDVVLMDCQMPVMDGYTAARRIRETELGAARRNRVTIIALTADGSEDAAKRCVEAGMDAVMTKPFGQAALIDLVERLVDEKARSV
ncbi:hypothetical protein KFL_004210010 [Klebsormidium nitens]|uniref:Histidine kinase n=1 Tax=Klebsormidium nitens TaxID=105231 RepID=A0A1Y1ICN4_KLENI|nr:hypothetical protein KFL_004210010 [Klebsormidium nitens]|eukprot:GAQ88353.1 hypothetical protein KFL_004210010 [Klebsormidium nitens]